MNFEKVKEFFKGRLAKTLAVFMAVLLIGVAVYVNYRLFYDPVGNMGFGDNNMEDNFDDSEATGSDAVADYFASVVLNRSESRDEALDVLKLVTESDEASEEAKAEANREMSKIATNIQNEANIEALVKAGGFDECVAVISEGAVSVIVSRENLNASDVAKIFTIVNETTGVSTENISVINRV